MAKKKITLKNFKYDPSIDYQSEYELLPIEIKELALSEDYVTEEYDTSADLSAKLLKEVEKKGWTFDYNFMGEIYSLRPIGEPEQEFSKGGSTYAEGGEIDKNKEYKGSVIGFKESGTGRAFHLGDIEIPKNSTPKSIISLAKSKFKRVWFIEVADKNGNYLYEISDDGQSPMVTTYAKGGSTYAEGGGIDSIKYRGTIELEKGDKIRIDHPHIKGLTLLIIGRRGDGYDYKSSDDMSQTSWANGGWFDQMIRKPKNELVRKSGSTYAEGGKVEANIDIKKVKEDVKKIKESRFFDSPFATQVNKNKSVHFIHDNSSSHLLGTLKQVDAKYNLNYDYKVDKLIEKYNKEDHQKLISEKKIFPNKYGDGKHSLKEFYGEDYWLYRLLPIDKTKTYAKGGKISSKANGGWGIDLKW